MARLLSSAAICRHARNDCDSAGLRSRAEVTLEDGQKAPLLASMFMAISPEETAMRGGEAPITDTSGYLHVPVSLTLLPGIELAWRDGDLMERPSAVGEGNRAKTVKHFSLNLLMGESEQLDGFELSPFINRQTEATRGGQIGMLNLTDGWTRGFRFAGVANYSRLDALSVEVAGTANVTLGHQGGAQVSGLASLADGGLDGAQFSGLFSHSGAASRGAQFSGLFSHTDGSLHGFQLAGLFNANSETTGAQLAGLFNTSEDVRGFQLAGLFNSARDVRGLQFGLVNVARQVKGVQFGLINVSEDVQGVPFGLINVVENGVADLGVATSDLAPAHLTLKLGARSFYTVASFGLQTTGATVYDGDKGDRWIGQVGFGTRFSIHPLELDVELLTGTFQRFGVWDDERLNLINTARFGLSYRIAEHLAIIGGPTVNVLITDSGLSAADLSYTASPFPGLNGEGDEGENVGDVVTTVWPGFFVGAQF